MKRLLTPVLLFSLVFLAEAADKAKLDKTAQHLVQRFVSMQGNSDKAIPADVLKKAQGIVLLERTKAGFIFAYQGGSGIAMVRDEKSGKWGPIAFLKANEASLGFQIGGQQSFLVLLLMNKEGLKFLTDPKMDWGGEARGTAGDATGGAEASFSASEKPIVVYDDREGLYGGAAIKGGAISPDEEANQDYYGKNYIYIKDILFDKKVNPTPVAEEFATKIQSFSKK